MKNWTTNYTKQFQGLFKAVEGFVRGVLIFFVALYRTVGSQFLGGQCRFHPSCSQYALEALETQNVPQALQLIIKRIFRCHPFGSSGWDPVPVRKEKLNAREQSATETF